MPAMLIPVLYWCASCRKAYVLRVFDVERLNGSRTCDLLLPMGGPECGGVSVRVQDPAVEAAFRLGGALAAQDLLRHMHPVSDV